MQKETRNILNKMQAVIDTASDANKDMANRYICLANNRLHRDFSNGRKEVTWGVVEACMSLEETWRSKFGHFKIIDKPIIDN